MYSTCSILKEENEKIIEKFLKQENFEIKSKDNGNTIENMVYSILPNELQDGFFICKLMRMG